MSHIRQRREDRTKGLIAGNLLLLIIFSSCVDLQRNANPHLLRNVWIAEIVCITCYVLNAFFSDGWLSRSIIRRDPNRSRDQFFVPMWVVVAINGISIAYLVWQTGGPAVSPYTTIPASLLVVGQQLRRMKPPQPSSSFFHLIWSAFWEFRLYVLIATVFYGALIYLQEEHAQSVSGPPPLMAVGVVAALFFVALLHSV